MSSGRLWKDGADDEVSVKEVMRKLRNGIVIQVSSSAGTHTIRKNPQEDRYGRREFTVIHHGYGGGYCGRHGLDAGTVGTVLKRADPPFKSDVPTELWPDEHLPVLERK